jgi:cholesterol transport system auxiliary component
MKKLSYLLPVLALIGCSINTPQVQQYKLEAFSAKAYPSAARPVSILVSQPDAVGGYQTEQMLYQNKPFALESFVKNTWVASPSNMLYPLILQSLQKTHFFHAVSSAPYADKADYRLDTQLIELEQNFLTKPSTVKLVVKVVITAMGDNRVVASRIYNHSVKSHQDTPYGGVVAANQATAQFTNSLSRFVVKVVDADLSTRSIH